MYPRISHRQTLNKTRFTGKSKITLEYVNWDTCLTSIPSCVHIYELWEWHSLLLWSFLSRYSNPSNVKLIFCMYRSISLHCACQWCPTHQFAWEKCLHGLEAETTVVQRWWVWGACVRWCTSSCVDPPALSHVITPWPRSSSSLFMVIVICTSSNNRVINGP